MPTLVGEYINFVVQDKEGKFLEMIYRPHIWFMFKINHKFTRPVAGLIDSGADRNLFPAEVGEVLGLNVKKGKEYVTTGIGNHQIITYRHLGIELFFDQGFHFRTEVDFSYDMSTLLLGGIGFFDRFKKVILQKEAEIVELEY
ncbi:MAG: hypothetical protein Q7S45_04975 [Candidatus Curtissbacteria bacterium]|nr:hypothetical protein [Candidatus Curtissbacteria bacterium]